MISSRQLNTTNKRIKECESYIIDNNLQESYAYDGFTYWDLVMISKDILESSINKSQWAYHAMEFVKFKLDLHKWLEIPNMRHKTFERMFEYIRELRSLSRKLDVNINHISDPKKIFYNLIERINSYSYNVISDLGLKDEIMFDTYTFDDVLKCAQQLPLVRNDVSTLAIWFLTLQDFIDIIDKLKSSNVFNCYHHTLDLSYFMALTKRLAINIKEPATIAPWLDGNDLNLADISTITNYLDDNWFIIIDEWNVHLDNEYDHIHHKSQYEELLFISNREKCNLRNKKRDRLELIIEKLMKLGYSVWRDTIYGRIVIFNKKMHISANDIVESKIANTMSSDPEGIKYVNEFLLFYPRPYYEMEQYFISLK